MPIDPTKVRLEPADDVGGVDVMYDDWCLVRITRNGWLHRYTSVGDPDLKVNDEGKIRLVK